MKRGEVTPERLALAAEVQRLRDEEGLFFREIQEALGLSRSYASSLYTDPDGSKARARKDRYCGVCVDCGRPTSGSMGRNATPERCLRCDKALRHKERKWTRETIIDAIQRFARAKGRPPVSYEWAKSDPANGYPAFRRVYGPQCPFARWSDAIEAAGFPRPLVGQYVTKPRKTAPPGPKRTTLTTKGQLPLRDYIILSQDDDGRWIQHGPIESYSEALAVEKYMESLTAVNGQAGRKFVAISTARWIVRELQPVTSFKAVASTPEVKQRKASRNA